MRSEYMGKMSLEDRIEILEKVVERSRLFGGDEGMEQIVGWLKELKERRASEPKPGYWVSSSNGWMCSNCRNDASHEFDFCPHCGADMKLMKESKEE